jgi:hypothetical protein
MCINFVKQAMVSVMKLGMFEIFPKGITESKAIIGGMTNGMIYERVNKKISVKRVNSIVFVLFCCRFTFSLVH